MIMSHRVELHWNMLKKKRNNIIFLFSNQYKYKLDRNKSREREQQLTAVKMNADQR